MFEDTFEKEMRKYDKFRRTLEEGETIQNEFFAQMKVCYLRTSLWEIGKDLGLRNVIRR